MDQHVYCASLTCSRNLNFVSQALKAKGERGWLVLQAATGSYARGGADGAAMVCEVFDCILMNVSDPKQVR